MLGCTYYWCMISTLFLLYCILFFETKARHANAKAQETVESLTRFFYQVERRFHNRETNRQPLFLGIWVSPPSSSSLRPPQTTVSTLWTAHDELSRASKCLADLQGGCTSKTTGSAKELPNCFLDSAESERQRDRVVMA